MKYNLKKTIWHQLQHEENMNKKKMRKRRKSKNE